jgi:hypothetical protein
VGGERQRGVEGGREVERGHTLLSLFVIEFVVCFMSCSLKQHEIEYRHSDRAFVLSTI